MTKRILNAHHYKGPLIVDQSEIELSPEASQTTSLWNIQGLDQHRAQHQNSAVIYI